MLNYINGEWIKPNVKEYYDVINPANRQFIVRTPLCDAEAVDAKRRMQPPQLSLPGAGGFK